MKLSLNNLGKFSRGAQVTMVFLLLATAPTKAQEPLTHEELLRRAYGLPAASHASNAPAPDGAAPVVASPANSATAIPPFPADPRRLKTTAPKFSAVPPSFYNPMLASSNLVTASTNVMVALDEKHLLAIGDRLSFRIVEDEEDPRALMITDSGELELPYLGRFLAEGKSCRELAYALKAEFEKEYYYEATVILAVDLMARSRGKVYFVGPVRMPGPQEIPSDEVLTLSKAVLRAGGFTDFADKKNVKVTRKSTEAGVADQTYTVNVAEILERGRTEKDLPLRSGDLIYVQERMIRF